MWCMSTSNDRMRSNTNVHGYVDVDMQFQYRQDIFTEVGNKILVSSLEASRTWLDGRSYR